MVRKNIRQAFQIAGYNFSMWKSSPRIYMTFVLAFVLCLMLSNQAITFAGRYETIMQAMEPFIWTFGDAGSVMLSSLLLVLLFADMPFVSQMTPYWLIRTKRSVWLAGQILYVVLATTVYNLFLLVVEGLLAIPFSYPGNVWSETAAMLGYGGGGANITLPVSIKTMEISTPYQCMVTVFLLMLLYSLFVAVLMLALNLMYSSAAGVIGAFAVNIYGCLLSPEIFQKLFHFPEALKYKSNVLCGWLSPLNHATFSMHNFGYDYLPSLWVSMAIFLALIIILTLISGRKMYSYNFAFSQINE